MDRTDSPLPDLTFVSEARASNHLAGWFFVGIGVLIASVGFVSPDTMIWNFLGGAVLAGFGGLVFYSASPGYPRLRIHGHALWIENRWRHGQILNLHELGAAHVLEVVTIMDGRNLREYCLCFLRREEEQALIEAGKPLPTDSSAYYRVLSLATLLPFDRARSDEIASVVNAHRPTWVPDLSDRDRKALARGPGDRQFFYLFGLFSIAAILALFVFVMRMAG